MTIRRKHRHSAMPPLCKGRWQKTLIFDGGVADTGYGANLDVSIPQSALRLPAPFTQGSQGVRNGHAVHNRCRWRKSAAFLPHLVQHRSSGAETRSPWCVTSGNTSSGERCSPPSRQGEGIALRRCMITTEAGLAPSGSPAAQILSNDAHPPRGEGQGA